MRVGLLGCGNIAYWMHLPALRRLSGVTLAAAADPDPTARERASRLIGLPVHERADELLDRSDIHAVVICTPTHLHAELAVAAAGAGKHFYLEKPIATTVADARRVIEAAAGAGVTGVIGFNRRLHPLYQQARALLRAGRIGRIRAVQTVCCEPMPVDTMAPWRRCRATGGGVLLELASHHVDQLRWLLGEEIVSVGASVHSELSEQDAARVELSMADGLEVQAYFSFRGALTDYSELIGERGSLRIDRHAPALSLSLGRRRGYGVRRPWVLPTAAAAAWRLQRMFRPALDPSFRRSLRAFVERARGRPTPSASLVDGLRSLEVVLAAEGAAESRARSQVHANPVEASCARC